MKTQFQLGSQEIQNGQLVSRLLEGNAYRLVPADRVPGPPENAADLNGDAAAGETVDLLPPDSAYTSTQSPGAAIWTASGGIIVGRKYWLAEYNPVNQLYSPVAGWPNYGPPTGNPPRGEFIGIVGTRQGSAQLSTREFGIERVVEMAGVGTPDCTLSTG